MEGSIEGDFCFGGCGQTAVSQVPAEPTESQKEDNFWNDAKAAGNVKAFEAYLEKYPTGRYSTLAKANIDRLSANNAVSSNPTSNETASRPQKGRETLARDELMRQEEQRRKELEESKRMGNPVRLAFLDAERLFKLTGETDNKENRAAFQLKVKNFADKYKIQLILNEAVFIVSKADLTAVFLSHTKGDSLPNNIASNLPKAPANFVKYIDAQRILNDSDIGKNSAKKLEVEFKMRKQNLDSISDKSSAQFITRKKEFEESLAARRNEENQKIMENANQKIQTLSKEKGYEIIVQEALYAAPELDITNEILMLLR